MPLDLDPTLIDSAPIDSDLSTNIDLELTNFFKIKSIGGFIHNLMQVLLAVASIATFFYLIWGGIEYITSGGEQDKVKSAKSKITQAIIGLAIVAVAWALWRLVLYFLGISNTPHGNFNINLL